MKISLNIVSMPKHQTKFCEQWLDQNDGNRHIVRWWCKADAKDVNAGYCKLYFKTINCGNRGVQQLLQHATGEIHKQIACVRFSQEVKHLVPVAGEGTLNSIPQTADNSTTSSTTFLVPKSHIDEVHVSLCICCFIQYNFVLIHLKQHLQPPVS